MKKKNCNTVIRIQTYEEMAIRTQKRTEQFRVSSVKPTNILSSQTIRIKQIDTKRFRFNKKIIFVMTAVLAAVLIIPFLFAAAANSNEVMKSQAISTAPAVHSNAASGSATPVPAATDGQLTSDLTEQTTLATPLPLPSALPVISALPAASPLPSDDGYLALSPGMTDPFVAMIQQRLMDLFYLDQDDPTTLYGPVTKQAVTVFQKQNGLTQTGVADIQTQSVLFSPAANPYIVKPGDTSPDVQTIQERLAELGFTLDATGTYGDDTTKAVQTFQKLNNLDTDGNVGNETRQALYSSEAKNASATPRPSKAAASSKPNTPADPNKVEAFINAAMAQLGKPYVLGGKGPGIFDCSGLVYYSLKTSGNGIGYMTSYDWADAGEYQRIGSMKDLQRGDVVCESGHVGIYLGNGHVVNASSSNGNVIVSQDIFSSSYWVNHFICGRRPF